MEADWYFKLVLLLIFLIFSALFSGAEVSLFSLDKKKLKTSKKFSGFRGNYIQSLLNEPRRLLVTILIGNTVFNVSASIVAVIMAIEVAELLVFPVQAAILIQIVVLTVLVLLFGEITPKVWAAKYPEKFAGIAAFPLYWISVLVYPVAKIITQFVQSIASLLHINRSGTAILSSELGELADIGVEQGTIEEDEHELIHGVVSFRSITAREVMTPRVDMTAVSTENTFDELMAIITESGHSRIPLFENNLDNIKGIIYAKALLPYLNNSDDREKITLAEIARRAMFIPETKLISELMSEFQEKNLHMGVVVDEYGGTAGLITLEDILEEIVGEIHDEYDKEENEITELEDGSFLVLGKTPIDELADVIEVDLGKEESDDFDTIGGFIFSHAGSIPEAGY